MAAHRTHAVVARSPGAAGRTPQRTTGRAPTSAVRATGPAAHQPLLELQQAGGNAAVTALVSRVTLDAEERKSQGTAPEYASLVHLVLDLAGPLAVQLLSGMGVRDRNRLTNLLFWATHPEMIGEKIQPAQKDLAKDWVRIRDTIVEPALQAPAPAAGPTGPTAGGGTTPEAPAPVGPAPTDPTPAPKTPTPEAPAEPVPAGAASLRDPALAAFVLGLKNPAADRAAHELAALEARSTELFAKKSGHTSTEEKGAGRDELVSGIRTLRKRIDGLDDAGLDAAVLVELKRRLYLAINDISPFYSQGRNIDLLEGKEQAKDLGTSTSVNTRTCNLTALGMALEGLGRTADDYAPGKRDTLAAVAAAFAPEVASATLTAGGGGAWGRLAALRLPDFLQLAAIAEVAEGATPSEEEILAAAKSAWGEILSLSFLRDLAQRFGAKTSVKPFTLDPSKTGKDQRKEAGAFKAWARKHRSKVEGLVDLRHKMEAATGTQREKLEKKYTERYAELHAAFGADAEKTVALEAYKKAVTGQIGAELAAGAQVEVSIAGHYVRLQAIHEDHVVVDDPARQARANRKVTWEEARAMGYFNYRLVLE